jgi:CBS domain-containing protein
MQLKEVMRTGVEVVDADAALQDAAQKMKELDVGTLPVVENDELVGILTDRDITVRATALGRDPNRTRVRDVITPDVVYCFEDQGVDDAARLMAEKQIRRLVILNHDHQLVGIVSLGDLALGSEREDMAGSVLQRVSEPSSPNR